MITNNTSSNVGVKMNQDTHPILLDNRDIVFMLNGDVEDPAQGGTSMFAQNQLSNRLCYEAPSDYEFAGLVDLNNNEVVLAYKTATTSVLIKLDKSTCSATEIANQPCLNFNPDYPIRGLYKYNSITNTREIYFIDGLNPDRYLDVDSPFPLRRGSSCEDCNTVQQPSCDELRIVRKISIPKITIDVVDGATNLDAGIYQVGIAHSTVSQNLSDYYFSRNIVLKERQGVVVTIDCMNNIEDYISVILSVRTVATPLVYYTLGTFVSTSRTFNINGISELNTVVSTQTALSKRSAYDTSEHIAEYENMLLRGKHQSISNIRYEPDAENITVKWVTKSIPKDKAYLFPTLMRDEVYAISIRWWDCLGRSRGVFEIPNKANPAYSHTHLAVTYGDTDIAPPTLTTNLQLDTCTIEEFKIWQVLNTATLTSSNNNTCTVCGDMPENNEGIPGYYECKDFTYPEEYTNLACEKVRRFRMPDTNMAPIHACETCNDKSDCINILGLKVENIKVPELSEGIVGYDILVSDRSGHESIIHKGLLFNMGVYQEGVYNADRSVFTPEEDIYYPNYPNNDFAEDPFLASRYSPLGNESDYEPHLNTFSNDRFTYHSPDIHYSERGDEFSKYLRVYQQEIGEVNGEFNETHLHGKRHLSNSFGGDHSQSPYINFGWQYDSVANYNGCAPSQIGEVNTIVLKESQYLLPIKQLVGKEKIKVNNNQREDSYYLQTKIDIPRPTVVDTTRFLFTDINNFAIVMNGIIPVVTSSEKTTVDGCKKNFLGFPTYTQETLNDGRVVQAVSNYVGIVKRQDNQYGAVYNVNYIPTDNCVYNVENLAPGSFTSTTVYGGDIYLSQHSIQRKLPFFTTYDDAIEDEANFEYNKFANLAYPEFRYASNIGGGGDYWSLNGWNTFYPKITQADTEFVNLTTWRKRLPKMYTSVNSMIYFWGESRYIAPLREENTSSKSKYYPLSDFTVQTKGEEIRDQEIFEYGAIFRNPYLEWFRQIKPVASDAGFVVSYSNPIDLQGSKNPWIEFLPLNYTLLSRNLGEFTGIFNTKRGLFFIFEDGIYMAQQDQTFLSEEGNTVIVGQGDVFSRKLQQLVPEDTGYAGSVDPMSFLNTRYGTFFYDRKRCKWFVYRGQLAEINRGMYPWFCAYVPQRRDLDSGLLYKESVIAVYDNYTDNVYTTFDTQGGKATLTYKPKIESILSFNSFKPDAYITANNYFLSIENNGVWLHDDKNPLMYCNYYGTQFPYKIGFILKGQNNSLMQHAQVFADFLKRPESNIHYAKWVQDIKKFFDKAVVFNYRHSTGLKDLTVVDNKNPNHDIMQNAHNPNIMEVSMEHENIYSFNKLENHQDFENSPELPNFAFTNSGDDYQVINVSTSTNPRHLGGIKGRWFKLFLESTNPSLHKIMVQMETSRNDNDF